VQAVRDAATLVLDVYSTDFSVDLKTAREPVTLADRQSNDLLCQRIAEAFPQDGIVAEESVPTGPGALERTVNKERVWFIDPLDGTKEFIARNGEFAIMVGLAVAGRPVLGIVGTPASGEIWVGISGARTWRLAADGSQVQCSVSRVWEFAHAALVVSRSHRSQSLLDRVERLGVQRVIACGSVGIKASRIACAQADLYVYLHAKGGAKLWDGCAPEALVLGAGGKVTNIEGGLINYATAQLELVGGFIATNGLLHERLLERVRDS
jgi:3'(2'), 5'-bisphosphate nucleotidase